MKMIEISMEIALIQLNYNLLQVFIRVFALDYLISGIRCPKQSLFLINPTNNNIELFVVLFIVFHTTQDGYDTKNGPEKATNTCLIENKMVPQLI